jgi:hypothetical protein
MFFVGFSNVLDEWLEKLVEKSGMTFRGGIPRIWTLELIRQVNTVSNWVSCVVDFWLDSILGGYINEFSIDCTHSYSTVEREFFKDPRERYLRSLSTWIKMLLCDKGIMRMESDY